METSSAPPLPPVPQPSVFEAGPPVHLKRLLLGMILAVAVFDLCFWDIGDFPGFSVSVFVLALAGIILSNREAPFAKRTTVIILALLVGACVASAIETCLTNTLVLLFLIIALAGDSYFTEVASAWGRWLSQVVALFFTPGRIFWLSARVMESAAKDGIGWTGGMIGKLLLAVPALVLALIFGSLLASGNAVFGSWTDSFFDWLWKELALYLDIFRIALWCFVAAAVLPLLRPADISAWWWKWTENLSNLPEIIPTRSALFSSVLVLVVLNLLFLVANVADALFLWGGQALPSALTYKTYVHEGVNSLIVTVILSAFVLTAIFQQEIKVVRNRGLKVLAFIWILQNLFLIFSVADKLKIYIENYEMTVARLSALIFLVLVTSGFVLLTIKIIQDRSVSWLIGGCVLATFATFYITQFLDLGGWSANYNVAQMVQKPWYRFDIKTMEPWGASIWPALRRAHELTPDDADVNEAWQRIPKEPNYTMETGRDWTYWREFSLRAYWNRAALDDKK